MLDEEDRGSRAHERGALGDKVGAVEAAATAINTSVGELTGGVDAAQQLAAGEAPPAP